MDQALPRDGLGHENNSSLHVSGEQLLKLHKAAAAVLQLCSNLDPVRRKTILERNQLVYEQEILANRRKFHRQSREEFLHHASNKLARSGSTAEPPENVSTTDAIDTNLKKKFDLLSDDHRALEEQEEALMSLQEDLSRTEFFMQGMEKELSEAVRCFTGFIEDELSPNVLKNNAAEDSQESGSSSDSRPEHSELDPVLDAYYGRVSDANILAERFYEVQSEYQETLAKREFERDQDAILELTDEEFQHEYRQLYDNASRAYDEAVREVDLAKQLCLKQGLNPDQIFPQPAGNLQWGERTSHVSSNVPSPLVQYREILSDFDGLSAELLRLRQDLSDASLLRMSELQKKIPQKQADDKESAMHEQLISNILEQLRKRSRDVEAIRRDCIGQGIDPREHSLWLWQRSRSLPIHVSHESPYEHDSDHASLRGSFASPKEGPTTPSWPHLPQSARLTVETGHLGLDEETPSPPMRKSNGALHRVETWIENIDDARRPESVSARSISWSLASHERSSERSDRLTPKIPKDTNSQRRFPSASQ